MRGLSLSQIRERGRCLEQRPAALELRQTLARLQQRVRDVRLSPERLRRVEGLLADALRELEAGGGEDA